MATKGTPTILEKFILLVVSVFAVLIAWSMIRYWLLSTSFPQNYIHFIDIGIVALTGLGATITLVRLIARPLAARVGPKLIGPRSFILR